MTRAGRWGLGVIVLFLLGSLAYTNREALVLGAVGMLVKQRIPVGPYEEITWSTGADPQGRAPNQRPPNIVLILADDLGWNDLSFGGGGVAGGTVPTPHIDSIAAEGVTFTNGYAANGINNVGSKLNGVNVERRFNANNTANQHELHEPEFVPRINTATAARSSVGVAKFCERCGCQFSSAASNFCSQCGTPRAS